MRKFMYATLMGILFTGSVISSTPAFAGNSFEENKAVQSGQTVEEIQETIDELLAQIADLQAQLQCQEKYKRFYRLNPRMVENFCVHYVRIHNR